MNLEQAGFVSFGVELIMKPSTILYSNLVKAPEPVNTVPTAASTTTSTTQKTATTTTIQATTTNSNNI